jgi:hypothetical protein
MCRHALALRAGVDRGHARASSLRPRRGRALSSLVASEMR